MTVNVLVFVYCVVFSVTRYMYDAWRRDFALSASFVSELECFDGSEVTGKGNDSIVQKQNCVVEEAKELEFIYISPCMGNLFITELKIPFV